MNTHWLICYQSCRVGFDAWTPANVVTGLSPIAWLIAMREAAPDDQTVIVFAIEVDAADALAWNSDTNPAARFAVRESDRERDIREAARELRDAMANPVISGDATQTLPGQIMRLAAERLRAPAASATMQSPDYFGALRGSE